MRELSKEELYRIQVYSLQDYAMFLIDPDGVLLSWNAGVEKLFGYSEDEWVGKHGSIIFTRNENCQEVFKSEMQKARDNGSSTDIRWHARKDGSEFFAEGFMNLVKDDEGNMLGYTKILSDETARKQLQDSLTESNAALEQFAYVASHDLQEPLRTMSAFSQLLADKYAGKLGAEADQILSFIGTAAGRMRMLVEDLLAFAKIATEVDRPGSVSLDEDLEAALTHLAQAVVESGATVTHDAMPVVQADRGQMVRLFQNLVGNALKYRKPDVPPEIHISAERRGPEWVISIRDNGIGFDSQFSSVIFAPFKRLHTNTDYPGTGVGLAICNRIVTMQGGRIWAESKPGIGSVFSFTLPVDGRPLPDHTQPISSFSSDEVPASGIQAAALQD